MIRSVGPVTPPFEPAILDSFLTLYYRASSS
jgi:hypothetical protein